MRRFYTGSLILALQALHEKCDTEMYMKSLRVKDDHIPGPKARERALLDAVPR